MCLNGTNCASWGLVGPMGDRSQFVWIGGKGTCMIHIVALYRYMHDSHRCSIHIIYVYIYMFTGIRIFLIIFLDVVPSQPILTPPPPLLLRTNGSLT
jgi:hypothetical protein